MLPLSVPLMMLGLFALPARAQDAPDPAAVKRGGDNKFGGIGSTPSFRILAIIGDSEERMRSFYDCRPHPVFVRVPGVPRWTDLPANATEITITPEQIEDLVAFTRDIARTAKRR